MRVGPWKYLRSWKSGRKYHSGRARYCEDGSAGPSSAVPCERTARPLSANFSAASGLWTVEAGDQNAFAYAVLGKVLMLTFYFANTTVSVATSELRIVLPAGLSGALNQFGTFPFMDGSVAGIGTSYVGVNETFIRLRKDFFGVTNWPAVTNSCVVGGTIPILIN